MSIVAQGRTPLHVAVEKGLSEAVDALARADTVNVQSNVRPLASPLPYPTHPPAYP